jgi:hypothetical protein
MTQIEFHKGLLPEAERALPQVIYHSSLLDERVPYNVQVDTSACARLLEKVGVPEEEIDGVTICLRRNMPQRYSQGNYRSKPDRITIATDPTWKAYIEYVRMAEDVIAGRLIADEKLFKDKLLPEEIAHLFGQGVNPFHKISSLMLQVSNREGSSVLGHEIKHAGDKRDDTLQVRANRYRSNMSRMSTVSVFGTGLVEALLLKNSPVLLEAGVLLASTTSLTLVNALLTYYSDPREQSAFSFQEEIKKNPTYWNLVNIKPKVPPHILQ